MEVNNRSASIHPCGHCWVCLKIPNLQLYGKCSVKKIMMTSYEKKIEEVVREFEKHSFSLQ